MGPRDPAGSWALKWRSRDRCGWSRCHLRALGVAAGQASRGSYSVWVLPLPTRFSQASEPRGSPQAGCGWQRCGTLESLSLSGPPVCTSPSSSDAGAGLRQLGGGRGLRVSRCSDRVSGRVAGWQLLRPGLDPSCSRARLRAFFSVHRPAALRPPGAQQRQDSTAGEAGGKTAPGGGAGGRGCARRPCCTGTVLAPRSQGPRPDPVFFLSPFFFCLQTARSAEWSPRAANAPVSQPPGVFCRTNSFVKIC